MVFRGYIAITHILLLLAILSAPNFFAAIIRGNSIPNEETVKRSKLNVRPQQTDASRPLTASVGQIQIQSFMWFS